MENPKFNIKLSEKELYKESEIAKQLIEKINSDLFLSGKVKATPKNVTWVSQEELKLREEYQKNLQFNFLEWDGKIKDYYKR